MHGHCVEGEYDAALSSELAGHDSLLLTGGEVACADGWGVALDGFDDGSGQLGAQGLVIGTIEVVTEVFTFGADGQVAGEEALDGVGNLGGSDAVAERTCGACIFADGAAYAKEEGIDQLAVLLDLFALETDVGNPVLAARVGAACDVEADLLVKAGEAVFELIDEPFVEALGFGDCKLAELSACAGNGTAPKSGDVDLQAKGVELDDEGCGLAVGYVDDEDVLADGGAKLAVAVLVGEIGEGDELVSGETAIEHGSSDGGEAGLALLRDAYVITVDVGGDDVGRERVWIELVAELFFEGGEEGLWGPAVAHEEILDAGAGAVLAELGLFLENLDDGCDDFEGFRLRDEGGDALGDVGFGGEAAADAEGVADLFGAIDGALDGGEGHVVDLGVGAPDGASGDGDLELAGKVVELGVSGELVCDLDRERAGVDEFGVVETGEGAAGDVADYVAAGSLGAEADGGEGVYYFDEARDGEPVELDVLAGGDVGEVAGVLLSELADDAGLFARENTVGQANTHHEELGGFALAVGAAGNAKTVALGVDAPPLEVQACPLGQDGVAALTGELTHFIPCVPGVFDELEALGLLGFGLFGKGCGLSGHWLILLNVGLK